MASAWHFGGVVATRQLLSLVAALAVLVAAGWLADRCGLAIDLSLRPAAIALAGLLYAVFAHDHARLLARWFSAYPAAHERQAIAGGALLGSLRVKLLTLGLWAALAGVAGLRALMLAYAFAVLVWVAARRLAGLPRRPAGPWGWLAVGLAGVLGPLDRGLAPLTGRVLRSPDLSPSEGLTPAVLRARAAGFPLASVHDMVGFVALHRELGVAEFAIGALLAGHVVRECTRLWPTATLAVIHDPRVALTSCLVFVALAGVCLVRALGVFM